MGSKRAEKESKMTELKQDVALPLPKDHRTKDKQDLNEKGTSPDESRARGRGASAIAPGLLQRVCAQDPSDSGQGLRAWSDICEPLGSGGSRLSIPVKIKGIDKHGRPSKLFGKILGNADIMTARTIQTAKNFTCR